MPTIDNRGDVDVDDVAFLQFIRIGNAMTDNFVHAGAARGRERVVVESAHCYQKQSLSIHRAARSFTSA